MGSAAMLFVNLYFKDIADLHSYPDDVNFASHIKPAFSYFIFFKAEIGFYGQVGPKLLYQLVINFQSVS